MNGELLYVHNPRRFRIAWILFYVVALALISFGAYAYANRIRTHAIPVGQVQLTIPYSTYLVGESVTFTLHNHYNSPIYVTNACPKEPLDVYRQERGAWVHIHDTASASDCATEEREVKIPASGSMSGSFDPWHNLFARPGKYRVVAYVEYYNALPYQDITIIAKPKPVPVTIKPSTTPLSTPPVQKKTSAPTTIHQPVLSGDDSGQGLDGGAGDR